LKIQIAAISRIPYLPYVYGVLRAYIEDMEPELSKDIIWGEPLFFTDRAVKLLDEIDMDTDVLGLSCYMWNFNRQMKLAKLHKERNPNCTIIVGGYHVPENSIGLMAFWANHPFIDIVVHGEGEITFAEILKRNLDVTGMPGVSTKTWCGGPVGPKLPKEIPIKSPYTAGYYDEMVTELNAENKEYWALWETNRGCPYACSFCEWGSALMNKVRRFSEKRVHDEISWFGRMQVKSIFLADANFGILPRDAAFAEHLISTKKSYGAPCQIKPTFAKRSNDRVFNISKSLSEAGMVYGTTLSMQSMDEDVLKAIDRDNIGLDHYRDLQQRYTEADVLTYTELILGLPKESKDTFINGMCELLENGNHNDIKVWELMMLPNAPMSADIGKYGLHSVRKNLFPELPNVPLDEVETKDVVVQTNTMSFEDWIDCYQFAIMVQTLHCGYYTRWISEFCHNHGISYNKFYTGLYSWAITKTNKFGSALTKIRNALFEYAEGQSTSLWMKIDKRYGPRRCEPHDWLWLEINKNIAMFYAEIHQFINEETDINDTVLVDLIRYNEFMMLHPSNINDTTQDFIWDWNAYFEGKDAFPTDRVSYAYYDTHTGIDDRYPLDYNDGAAFARAAVGDGFYLSRYHHYIHREVRIYNHG
jgi:putative methyltransferase